MFSEPNKPTCYLIGRSTLLIRCGSHLQKAGVLIKGVFSEDPAVIAWAEGAGFPVEAYKARSDDSAGVDFLFSIVNFHVLNEAWLKCASKRAVNFHDGPLPQYAGRWAPTWALYRGENRHGISWHEMSLAVDKGKLLATREVGVKPDDTSASLNARCFQAAYEAFEAMLPELLQGRLEGMPQSTSKGRFYPAAKRPLGLGLLDWRKSAEELAGRCRAYDFGPHERPWGWPKVLARLENGERVLYLVGRVTPSSHRGEPGRILSRDTDALLVACAQGALKLEQLTTAQGDSAGIDRIKSMDPLPRGVGLNAFHKQCAPYEDHWRRLLAEEPLALPDRGGRQTAQIHRVGNPLELLAAFLEGAKTHGKGALIGLRDQAMQPPTAEAQLLFAGCLPFPVESGVCAGDEGRLEARLRRLRATVGHRVDLARSLTQKAATHFPVQVSLDAGPVDEQAQLALEISGKTARLSYTPQWGSMAGQLLAGWKGPSAQAQPTVGSVLQGPLSAYPDQTLDRIWRKRAAGHAERTALVFGRRSITYQALDQRSDDLAAQLLALGAGPGVLVGLHLDRRPDLVVAMLAILKSGAAYLPLDPHYPAERLAFQMEDAVAPIFLCRGERPDWLGEDVAVLDPTLPLPPAGRLPENLAGPADPAYVIYTSGSTGKPKGVVICHRAAVNFLFGMRRRPGMRRVDRMLAVTSISFDIAVLELFLPLVCGATLILAERAEAMDGTRLAELLDDHAVTIMQATPSTWELLLSAGWQGNPGLKMLCGGEAMPRRLADRLIAAGHSLWNMYGPTETTVWSTTHLVQKAEGPISIGRPIANTCIYILDENQEVRPRGEIGELWIGGDGLSRGYLGRPDLTDERFQEVVVDGVVARIYRTGDLAAVGEDGRITFHGRVDHQVKIRGFRIELEEIEAVLAKHPAVDKAVVAVKGEGVAGKRLVAYLRAQEKMALEAAQLRRYLSEILPDYMVPDILVTLHSFPLTPNGKVDRNALPQPVRANTLSQETFAQPEEGVEQQLAVMWQDLLDLDQVGASDDFFELGGNSLLVERLSQRLKDWVGAPVSPVLIFANPTLSRLAAALLARFESLSGQRSAHQRENGDANPQAVSPSASEPSASEPSASTIPLPEQAPIRSAPNQPLAEMSGAFVNAPRPAVEPIAIIGLACRFPGAANQHDFFENLCRGVDAVNEVPHDRWDYRALAEGRARGLPLAQASISDMDCFDHAFFGMPLHEARRMDPLQRVFLEIAQETVEDAGYRPDQLSRTGVYVGLIAGEFPRVLEQAEAYYDAHAATGSALSLVANRVSYTFDWEGPSLVVDTACSGSLVGLDIAVRALREGQIDNALVGGINIILTPDNTLRFAAAGMLSENGRCFSFDDRANGYVRGEGAGAVLLKPLAKAQADGDHIWALVRGTAVNHDGGRKMGLTAPNPNAQEALLAEAYRCAGIEAGTVGYLEAHGTGTPLGDPIEVEALSNFFSKHAPRPAYCALGSVKANIGHLEPAAGIAGLIKATLCLKHATLPPTLHISEPNRRLLFEQTPFYLNDRLRAWSSGDHPRRAGVSSFGYGGANAHVILEQPPQEDGVSPDETGYLLCLSTHEPVGLRRLVKAWIDRLERGDLSVSDMCRTAAMGRRHYACRLALVAHHGEQLVDKLRLFLLTPAPEMLRGTQIFYSASFTDLADIATLTAGLEPGAARWVHRCFKNSETVATRPAEISVLDALAEAYARGLTPNWEQVFAGQPTRRVSLPTYPFARTRIWIDRGEARSSRGIHPLIKQEMASLHGACYMLDVDGSWMIEEHRVQGRGVLPGMALLDLALFVARKHLPQGSAVELKDLEFRRPVRNGVVLCLLLQNQGQGLRIGVYEWFRDEPDLSHPYFSTTAQSSSDQTAEFPADRYEEIFQESVEPRRVYTTFAEAGLAYGPRFQVLGQVGRDQGRVCADLHSKQSDPVHALDPALADGALQAALIPHLEQELFVPFYITAVSWFAPLGKHTQVLATDIQAGGDSVRANLCFSDKHGRVAAAFRGIHWRVFQETRERRLARNRLRLPVLIPDTAHQSRPLPKGLWLVFGDAAGLSERLIERLETTGNHLIRVQPAQHFSVAGDSYTLRPDKSEDYKRLLENLETPPVAVLFMWPLREEAVTDLDLGLHACFLLARRLEKIALFQVFTRNALGEKAQPAASALAGLVRTLRRERPAWNARLIDLHAPTNDAKRLFRELGGPQAELVLAPAANQRLQRLKPVLRPLTGPPATATSLRRRGTYLITGGMGGLGQLLAGRLAQHYEARVALIGRSQRDLPRQLAELRDRGHQIVYFQADVTDETALAQTLAEIVNRWGGLDGVFHAAGLLRDGLIAGLSEADFHAVLAPKVQGAEILARLTARMELDFILFFSSISGLEGNLGQAAYAAANRYLDALARRLTRRGRTAFSVAFGLWTETGMGVDFVATAKARNLAGHTNREGLAIIEAVLREGLPHIAVAPASAGVPVPPPALASVVAPETEPSVTSGPTTLDVPQKIRVSEKADTEQALALVIGVLAEVLEQDEDSIEADTPFLEAGLDSLLAVKVVDRLEQRSKLSLPPTLLFDYPNGEKLAEALVEDYGLLHADDVATPEAVARVSVLSQQIRKTSTAALTPTPPGNVPLPEGEDNPSTGTARPGDLAVVGMAGRFPGAGNIDELWQVLTEGRCQITDVPKDRWDVDQYFVENSDEEGSIYARWGGFLDDLYSFDPMFFRLSPKEAAWLDPQQRLLLETAWEAVENAGYAGAVAGTSTGVFVGASYTHYRDIKVGETMAAFAGLGNHNAILANRVSYFLDLRGPCLTVDTLCSSSLVALQLAVQQLRSGSCDQALVAGVHAGMSPKYFQMACRLRAFSPSGRCHSFDAQADGFTPGEGCGVLMLKPLQASLEAGDYIHGVIRGVAVNHGGQGSGLTVPRSEAQGKLVRAALDDAGVSAGDIGYVEAHGTGTALGDPIEIDGLKRAFSRDTHKAQFCGIGSLKTNIGHLEPAAGIAGLIKVLLCLEKRILPPSLLSSEINPKIRFEESPFYLVDRAKTWDSEGPRRAGVSSFGMGGVNGHAILEEAPAAVASPVDERPQLLLFSARDEEAVIRLRNRLIGFDWTRASLADAAYTLAEGRARFPQRLALTARSGMEIRQLLEDDKNISRGRALPQRKFKPALLFTGQGSQIAGMGMHLYRTHGGFRDHLDQCRAVLDNLLPHPVLEVLADPDPTRINQTGYAQPLLFAHAYALTRVLQEAGLPVAAVLGHSVGEYVAAVVAEVLSLEDGLRLIAERARLMQAQPLGLGAMAAVRAPRGEIEALLRGEGLSVAAENGPTSVVVSGEKPRLHAFLERHKHLKAGFLNVSHAFHSPLMKEAADGLAEFAMGISFQKPSITLISNLTGKPMEHAPDGAWWRDHLLGTVQFAKSVESLAALGVTDFVEVGPKPVLTSLCATIPACDEVVKTPMQDPRWADPYQAMLHGFGSLFCRGFEFDWNALTGMTSARRVPLPTYPFERRKLEVPTPTAQTINPTYHPLEDEHPLLGRRLTSPA